MIRKQIKWLIENMDPPCRKKQLLALCICVFTCVLLLVNPALCRRLIDDVIMAQNPDPLIPILTSGSAPSGLPFRAPGCVLGHACHGTALPDVLRRLCQLW